MLYAIPIKVSIEVQNKSLNKIQNNFSKQIFDCIANLNVCIMYIYIWIPEDSQEAYRSRNSKRIMKLNNIIFQMLRISLYNYLIFCLLYLWHLTNIEVLALLLFYIQLANQSTIWWHLINWLSIFFNLMLNIIFMYL